MLMQQGELENVRTVVVAAYISYVRSILEYSYVVCLLTTRRYFFLYWKSSMIRCQTCSGPQEFYLSRLASNVRTQATSCSSSDVL